MQAEDLRPLTRRTAPSANDIFALVKQFMHDERLCQKPLLVFPGNFISSARMAFQGMNAVPGVLSCQLVVRGNLHYLNACA
jgi:hypothetical protein